MSEELMLSPSERSALRANWSSATMVEVLKHWAEKNGDKEVFCFHQSAPSLAVGSHGNNTQTRTYAELDKTASLIARGLQRMRLSKQARTFQQEQQNIDLGGDIGHTLKDPVSSTQNTGQSSILGPGRKIGRQGSGRPPFPV